MLALITGCSPETRQKVLPYVFDGFSTEDRKPFTPTRRVRRDLLVEIDALARELKTAHATIKALDRPQKKREKLPVEQAETWEKVVELTPKDATGRIDWMQALKDGVIAPSASPDPDAPAQAVLDLDVELTGAASRLFRVVYPHAAHTAWLACGNCHPAIFPLGRKAVPAVITMKKIRAGEQCGVCHGKVAFAVDGECPRCHKAIPAKSEWRSAEQPRTPTERAGDWSAAVKLLPHTLDTPDWVKAFEEGLVKPRPGVDPNAEDGPQLPLDVELVPKDNAAFKVVFPHAAHTAWLSCENCHTAIFQMAKGADPITMEKVFAGEYCGRCHGKVAFQLTACGRCHPALAGAK
jgi:c(7)-type cytochrome triheme protein